MFEISSFALILEKITEPVIIIIAGLIIGRILGKIVKYVLIGFKIKKIKIHRIGENLVKYIVYLFAIFFAIKRLGVSNLVYNILMIVILFSVFLLLIFQIGDFILNFVAWFYIRKKFKEGHKITVAKITGKIKKIGLTKTKITCNKDILIIPNSFIKNHPK